MKWPTTLILMSIIGSTTVLGVQGTVPADVVTNIYTAIVSGVLVGHYVKTSSNGAPPLVPPGSTATIETPATATTITTPAAPADDG
jgi:hypothetical protein